LLWYAVYFSTVYHIHQQIVWPMAHIWLGVAEVIQSA